MTPERLAKVRAIAEDPRADPATRAIAQAKLDAQPQPSTRIPSTRKHDGRRPKMSGSSGRCRERSATD